MKVDEYETIIQKQLRWRGQKCGGILNSSGCWSQRVWPSP